ncbi:hypothetical protein NMG29_30975 [Streptomyces cocklensis]|jgi:hypothetical protein|uniref:Lipoprotein n=1 Tax=Actinacidiphila cocklensis TaxID=887465 RepID=A0A9W4GQS2_9ACTN|nr:hypothetical protein [Actinacidiphila cocklensis]MDD1062582.1 hypothetical protein [Actinacidiphila cocklensis]WSX72409.1 hypothetical protein OH826_00090 [Streptomyces sp. NBC_00899]WSX81520.1 hypothetical protein OH826_51405 [Streptomyces sp. NBC_00899]CAG6391856.1 conserved exported hypothetical protein [Actinacidiphila cocklensis]
MQTTTGARYAWRSAALVCVLVAAAGCGGNGTPVRDAQAVTDEVATQSDAVLTMTQVKGKVSGSGATEVSCNYDNDDDPNREMLNMWSLHGLDNTVLGKAMANLAAGLPEKGWKVVKNGPDRSMSRSQEIQAVHLATKTQLDATWQKNLQRGDPMIVFHVYSRCFRKPSDN